MLLINLTTYKSNFQAVDKRRQLEFQRAGVCFHLD